MWSPFKPLPRFTKRKLEDPDPLPSKIHITEEKMANQLSGLHLSNDYTAHGSTTEPEPLLPTLSLCEEIRALQCQPINIIPEGLIERPRSNTALVLWKPPAGDLGRLAHLSEKPQKQQLSHLSKKSPTEDEEMEEVNISDRSIKSFSTVTRAV